MRPLIILAALALSACSGYHTPARRARSIQQLTPGQSMLAAKPVHEQRETARATIGVGVGGGQAGLGEYNAELHTPISTGHGDLALRAGKVELSGIFDVAVADSEDGDWGVASKGATMQYGGRFRASPGTGRFHFNMSFELGMRHYQTLQGPACGEYEGQPCGEDDILANVEYARPYFATTIYPTLRIGSSLYLFAGVGFDTGMMIDAAQDTYDYVDEPERSQVKPTFNANLEPVSYTVIGADLRLGDRLAALLQMRSISDDGDDYYSSFKTTQVDAAVSMTF